MRLVSPYNYLEVLTVSSVAIAREDITEYVKEVPEDALFTDNLEWLEENILLVTFDGTEEYDYDFKTVFFLTSEHRVLGVLNETRRQKIRCETLRLKITLKKDDQGIKDIGATMLMSAYVDDSNPYYRPSTKTDIITTKQEATVANAGDVMNGLIVQKNTPHTNLLINFYFPATTKTLVLLPNVIKGIPTLGIITGVNPTDRIYWINYSKRKCYTDSYFKLRGVDSEECLTKDLLGFFDSEGNDRILGYNSEGLSDKYFLCMNNDTEILWLCKNEEMILGQTYTYIEKGFGLNKSIFSSSVRRYLLKKHLVIYDKMTHKGVIFKIATSEAIYFYNQDHFFLIPNHEDFLLYVTRASKDFDATVVLARNSWINSAGEVVANTEIIFNMFSEEYILRDKHIIQRLNE